MAFGTNEIRGLLPSRSGTGRPGARRESKPLPVSARWSLSLINVLGLLALLFVTGGSSRPDVWSLPLLRPVAVLSLFYGIWSLSWKDVAAHRFIFGFAISLVALVVAHLVPLPPFVWRALSGRELIVAIDAAADMTDIWRPISMAPEFTWNALFALAIPLAVLTNGARLSVQEHRIVVMALLAGGAVSVVLGLMQVASGGEASLYIYHISNFGSPSGLFANRNHQAMFLAAMLPLLGFLIASRDRRSRAGQVTRFLAASGALIAVALIVVLGSRAGLAMGLVGFVAFALIALFSGQPGGWRRVSRTNLTMGAIILMIVGGIVAWSIFVGSAESVNRTIDPISGEDLRYRLWPIISGSLSQFMPFGSGIGSYERIFQTIEPDSVLNVGYSNHAHNDWLEVVITAGIPGIILMAVAAGAFVLAVCRTYASRVTNVHALGWMGLAIILIAAIGSVVDYPLRTPIISALFSLASVWVVTSLRLTSGGNERR